MGKADIGYVRIEPMSNNSVLADTVRELDQHVADNGWDQAARLFAIVPTADLATDHPELVSADNAGQFMFVEQDAEIDNENLIGSLEQISWPQQITGAAIAIERLISMQPDDEIDPDIESQTQELRIIALVMRDGSNMNAIRQRSFDDVNDVAVASDLVPALNAALLQTFA